MSILAISVTLVYLFSTMYAVHKCNSNKTRKKGITNYSDKDCSILFPKDIKCVEYKH